MQSGDENGTLNPVEDPAARGSFERLRKIKLTKHERSGEIIGILEWGSGVSFRCSLKVNLPLTSAAAGLISLDSRVRGNDENGSFLTFHEFVSL